MTNGIRFIDANKANIQDIECGFGCSTDLWCVEEWFNSLPTVDAVEVVHAHWEDGCAVDPKTGRIIYKSIDCSHCEEVFKIESHDREYWKARFKVCPFCGAKMDGEI